MYLMSQLVDLCSGLLTKSFMSVMTTESFVKGSLYPLQGGLEGGFKCTFKRRQRHPELKGTQKGRILVISHGKFTGNTVLKSPVSHLRFFEDIQVDRRIIRVFLDSNSIKVRDYLCIRRFSASSRRMSISSVRLLNDSSRKLLKLSTVNQKPVSFKWSC